MPDTKLAKRCGYLPGVSLSDLDSEAAMIEAPELADRVCGHPDHGDPEIADADPADIARYLDCSEAEADFLKAAHQRMVAAQEATGRGSFPAGCYPDLYPNNHAAKVFLDFDSFPQHYTRAVKASELEHIHDAGVWGTREEIFDLYDGKPMLTVAMELTNETYRLVGCAHVMTTDGPNGKHNIHIKAERIPGSTIGYAYFNNQTCRDHVNQRIDSGWQPSLYRCALLLAHECGHNHNLEHTFANQSHHHGIMSYNWSNNFWGYSTGREPHTLPLDPALRVLKRHYGGEPVPPIDDPDTPDPPDPPNPDPQIVTVRVPRLPVTIRVLGTNDPEDPPVIDF